MHAFVDLGVSLSLSLSLYMYTYIYIYIIISLSSCLYCCISFCKSCVHPCAPTPILAQEVIPTRPQKTQSMATKLVLVVAALAFTALADPSLDPATAKDVAKAFEEALMEEAPLLKAEEKKADGLRHQALVRTHLRASKDEPAPLTTEGETGEWASTFEKDVSELAMGLSKGGFGATPMGDSVAKIAELIEKDMMPKVLKAHDDDQKELDRLAKEIATCGTTKTTELAAADKRKVTYQASSKSHKSCRSDEAALYTENVECHKDWKAAKETPSHRLVVA